MRRVGIVELNLPGLRFAFVGQEKENRIANADMVAMLQHPLLHADFIDLGAVATLEIANLDSLALLPQDAVAP